MRAPIRLKRIVKVRYITHSSRTHFFPHSKPPPRPRRVPDGSRSIWSRRARTARSPASSRAISNPFARRIRVRRRLGRGLRARGRQLLPKAAGVGAVHARDRAAPAGRAGAASRCDPRRARLRPRRACAIARSVLGACDVRADRRMEASRRARLSPAHRPAVPLGECRLRDVRRFPQCACGAQTQGDPARAARSARAGHRGAMADRLRSDRERVGRVLRLLHGDRLAQMGPAVSDARSSIRSSARRWPTASCW